MSSDYTFRSRFALAMFVFAVIAWMLYIPFFSLRVSQAETSVSLFTDNFDQNGDDLVFPWRVATNASNPEPDARESETDDDWNGVEVSGKALLLEGAAGTSGVNDEGAEIDIPTKGYAVLYLQYSRAINSFEDGDSFSVSYSLDGGAFQPIETLTVNQAHSNLPIFTIQNPERHTKLTVRFIVKGDDNDDEVGIDNLTLSGDNSPLFYDGFESGNFTAGGWTLLGSPNIDDENDAWTGNNSAVLDASSSNTDDTIIKSKSTTGLQDIKVRYARKAEGLDSNENLSLSYALVENPIESDWHTLEAFTNDNDTYGSILFSISSSSANNNSHFKIRLGTNGNESNDNGYVDDIVIFGSTIVSPSPSPVVSPSPSPTIEVSPSPSISPSPDISPSPSPTVEVSPSPSISPEVSPSPTVEPSPSPTIVPSPDPVIPGSISGIKFEDANGDGDLDEAEIGLPDWTIQLYDASGETLIDSQVTNSLGVYSFINLQPATYILKEVAQVGWTQTMPAAATYNVEVESDTAVNDVNFGNFHAATVNGFKFHDRNFDGVWQKDQPTEEIGVTDWAFVVTKFLSDLEIPTYHIVSIATTSSDGQFSLLAPKPGTYRIFEEQKTNWLGSAPSVTATQSYNLTSDTAINKQFDLTRYFDVQVQTSGQIIQQGIQNIALAFGNINFTTILGIKFAPTTATIDATNSAFTLEDGVISLSKGEAGTTKIHISKNTKFDTSDEQIADFNLLKASASPDVSIAGSPVGTTLDGAVFIGLATRSLDINEKIVIDLFVGSNLNGKTLNVTRSNIPTANWTTAGIIEPATCVVSESICTFSATKAGYFIATHVADLNEGQNNQNSGGGSSGGGSGGSGGGGGGSSSGSNGTGAVINESNTSTNTGGGVGGAVPSSDTSSTSSSSGTQSSGSPVTETDGSGLFASAPTFRGGSQASGGSIGISETPSIIAGGLISPTPFPSATPTTTPDLTELDLNNRSLLAGVASFAGQPLGKFLILLIALIILIVLYLLGRRKRDEK